MPYGIFRTGPEDKQFCVHKHDIDGEAIGRPLGCHDTREGAETHLAALYAAESKTASVVHLEWAEARKTGDWELEVLGIPYYGPNGGKDEDGEFFSPRTDIMLKVGDKRPVIYNHGADPENKKELYPSVIGEAEYIGARPDGHWFKVRLNRMSEYAGRIMDAAKAGMARASSGAVNYLTRILKATGEILVWPFSELTLIDYAEGKREPANNYAVARLKTIYAEAKIELPEMFAEGDEPKADVAEEDCGCSQKVSVNPEYLAEVWRYRRANGGTNGTQ